MRIDLRQQLQDNIVLGLADECCVVMLPLRESPKQTTEPAIMCRLNMFYFPLTKASLQSPDWGPQQVIAEVMT